MNTSGETKPVWVHHMPYDKYPQFPPLTKNIQTDVCIVGAGIAGISIAYELVNQGQTSHHDRGAECSVGRKWANRGPSL